MVNPIGSQDPADFKVNVGNLDKAMNDQTSKSWTDRFGVDRFTWFGIESKTNEAINGLAFKIPVDYAAGLNVNANGFTVTYNGVVYAPQPSAVPFTTGAWDAAQWYPIQNLFNKNNILVFEDYASASAAAATLPDGQVVISDADEIRGVVDNGAIAQEQSIYKVADYAKIRSYTGRGTRLRVVDPTGAHWWVRRGSGESNDGTILKDALERSWEREFSGPADVKWFGANGDGITDDTAAIQAAINSLLPLRATAGTYILRLSTPINLEAGATVCALVAKTGMSIIGDGMGRTVFKIKDGESTDASPKFFNMIASNQVLENIYLNGISFDLNGQNNPISPNRASGVYNPYNCAALMVSGSVATVGVDARVSRSKILYCEVLNSPGVTGFALGQRYGNPGVKGRDVEIAHCRFYNNGIDSADHSSIYGFCDGLSAHDNEFDFPTPSTGHQGPVACIESFGSGGKFYNNRVRNYLQFMWVGCGEEGAHTDIQIHGNSGSVSYRVVDTWSFGPQNKGLARIQISNNQFTLTGDTMAVSGVDRVAINLVMGVADMSGVVVRGNDFHCTDRSSNVGVVISAGVGRSVGSVTVTDNTFSGFSRAIAGGGEGNLLDIEISNNKLVDFAPTTARPSDTRAIDFSGANPFCTLRIYDNDIGTADTGAAALYGVVIAGTYASIHVDNNVFRCANELSITAVITGRRTGRQARLFNLPPTASYWIKGDEVFNSDRVELGTVGAKYVIDGWTRATTGSGSAASDWWQRRSLTGN